MGSCLSSESPPRPQQQQQQQQQHQQQEYRQSPSSDVVSPPYRPAVIIDDGILFSRDPRVKILALFSSVSHHTLPRSWKRDAPIERWDGITLDASGEVIDIVASNKSIRMRGSLNNAAMQRLDVLFPSLKLFDIRGHMLSGPCALNFLPPWLTELDLTRHPSQEPGDGLSGPLDIASLPKSLSHIDLGSNSFSGTIDWAALSGRPLRSFWVPGNRFEGTVEPQHLPRSVTAFSIEGNKFDGGPEYIACDLTHLPGGIRSLFLHNNPDLTFVGQIGSRRFPLLVEKGCLSGLRAISVDIGGGPSQGGMTINGKELFLKCRVAAALKSGDTRDCLLELFRFVVENLPKSWNKNVPLTQWDGIEVDDTGQDVIGIAVQHSRMTGYLNNSALERLKDMFPRLKKLDLRDHMLNRLCTLDALPHTLEWLDLRRWGTKSGKIGSEGLTFQVDWKKFAALKNLQGLILSNNNFFGSVSFSHLRHLKQLVTLSIQDNDFSGEANICELPRSVKRLLLHGNDRSGGDEDGLRLVGFIDSGGQPLQLDDTSLRALPKLTVYVGGLPLRGDTFYYRMLESAMEMSSVGSGAPSPMISSGFGAPFGAPSPMLSTTGFGRAVSGSGAAGPASPFGCSIGSDSGIKSAGSGGGATVSQVELLREEVRDLSVQLHEARKESAELRDMNMRLQKTFFVITERLEQERDDALERLRAAGGEGGGVPDAAKYAPQEAPLTARGEGRTHNEPIDDHDYNDGLSVATAAVAASKEEEDTDEYEDEE